MRNIFENDSILVVATGRDYDFIATIENKTDDRICLVFNDTTGLEPMDIQPNNWIGIEADHSGYMILHAIRNNQFMLRKE